MRNARLPKRTFKKGNPVTTICILKSIGRMQNYVSHGQRNLYLLLKAGFSARINSLLTFQTVFKQVESLEFLEQNSCWPPFAMSDRFSSECVSPWRFFLSVFIHKDCKSFDSKSSGLQIRNSGGNERGENQKVPGQLHRMGSST